MVQRPCPDLRAGCAAMRIPTATAGGRLATAVSTAITKGNLRSQSMHRTQGRARMSQAAERIRHRTTPKAVVN